MRLFSTSTQVWLFLIAVSLGSLFAGYELGGRFGLLLGLLFAFGLHFFIFLFGESALLRKISAVPIAGRDPWRMTEMVGRLCTLVELLPPEICLVNTFSPLAFTLGQPWRRGRLVLSTGLIEKLSPDELESVIAHQLGHLHHMDSFGFGVIAGVARLVLGFAHFLDSIWPLNFWIKQKQEPFIHALAPLAWIILRIAVNDKSYFQNDDLAVAMVKNKRALAEALWKMEGLSRTRPYALPPCTSHYFVVNPQGTSRNKWLESHPPVTQRIRRLIGTDLI